MRCPACEAELPDAAKFCLECGQQLGPERAGEVRVLTAMFADMSGSVAATYGIDPESATDKVEPILAAMAAAVTRHGGVVDRFLGDGMLALFGSVEAREDDAEKAIHAGLEICAAIAELGAGATVGINTGPAYVGRIGGSTHVEHTAMGTTINLAARLQANADAGEVVVGAPTRAAARGGFEFIPRTVQIKGVGELTAYAVAGAVSDADRRRLRGFEGRTAEIVGRDSELAELRRAVAALADGVGTAVCIIGEPGLGKSRLLAETIETARASGVRVLEGRCVESATASFAPFVDALRDWADPAALAGARHELVAAVDPTELNDLIEGLSLLLGLEAAPSGVDPTALRNRLHATVERTINALAASEPLMLVMEDLHWADPLSLGAIQALFSHVPTTALLMVCAYRPEVDHGCWRLATVAGQKAPGQSRELRLHELSGADTARMLESLVGLPADAVEMLGLDRAEGNPLFVEELVVAAVEAGIVVPAADGWAMSTTAEGQPAPLTPTLQTIVHSRVDRLPDELRQVLHAASVIGRSFPVSLLERLVTEVDVAACLDRLETQGFVFQDRVVPEVEYCFKHVLVQETVYESILRREREPLHRSVAQAIEEVYPDRLEEQADRLARHWDRTTDHARAFAALAAAGRRAQHECLQETAEDWFRRALERADAAGVTPGERAELWERLGEVQALAGNHEPARQSFKECLALLEGTDPVHEAAVLRKIGAVWVVQRNFEAALESYGAAVNRLGGADEEASRSELHDIVLDEMMLNYWRNDPGRIGELVAAYGRDIETIGTPAQQTKLAEGQVMQRLRETRYRVDPRVIEIGRRLDAGAQAESNLARAGYLRFWCGFILSWSRQLEEAEEKLTSALRIARKAGDAVTESRCLTYLAVNQRFAGHVDNAESWARQGLALAQAVDMLEYEGAALGNLAWVAARRGDFAEAQHLAESALELWDGLALVYAFQWIARMPILQAAKARRDTDAVLAQVEAMSAGNQQLLFDPMPDLLAGYVLEPSANAADALIAEATRLGYA